ncbi:MAG: hypothetical protein AB7P40_18350 [Chloroflexota bacterium]
MAERFQGNTHLAETADTRRWPRAVMFVAGLSMVEGTFAVLLSGAALAGWWLNSQAMQDANISLRIDGAVLLGIDGIALLLAGIGLLRLAPWAWTLAMATQCLTLTVTLYEYLSNDPDYLLMALGVLAVLLLNRQEVRLAFDPTEHRHD